MEARMTAPSDYAAAALTAQASHVGAAALHRAYPGAPDGNAGTCAEVQRRFAEWANSEGTLCAHAPGRTQLFWMPGMNKISCVTCYATYGRSISGTPEDHTCDLCRAEVGGSDPLGYGMAVVAAQKRDDLSVWPAVTIHFAACSGCIAEYADAS
jgi:hypothetical protein